MSTSKFYRTRGFQHRRIAFALKVLTALWLVPSIGLFLTGRTWMHLLAAITSFICFAVPSLLLATAFDHLAEQNFLRSTAAKNQALLGVVRPKVN